MEKSKPELNYVEYHVAYHCNLKCKGCTHYSNIAQPEFGNLVQFQMDMERLSELFANIKKIRLLGGEPLLNAELPEFIKVCRTIFPYSDIRVVSNGLLIPNIKEAVLTTMRDCKADFDITQYPPTQQIIDKIKSRCNEFGLICHVSLPVTEFFDLRNDAGDSNPQEMYEHCISRTCHFLENGKISLCPRPLIYAKFGKEVGIEDDFLAKEIIDIYSDINSGEELLKLFSQPIESCKYCETVNKKLFSWEGNHPYL